MEHCAGIDVSLELSSVCVVDTQRRIAKETKVASESEALLQVLRTDSICSFDVGLAPGGPAALITQAINSRVFARTDCPSFIMPLMP